MDGTSARNSSHGPRYDATGLAIEAAGRLIIPTSTYTVVGMCELYDIELEPEIEAWLDTLPLLDFARVDDLVGELAELGTLMDEPHSRHLGDGLRELRKTLSGRQTRITYWLAPGRRAVLLTVFVKTQRKERRQVERARKAMAECQASHEAAHTVYERDMKEDG